MLCRVRTNRCGALSQRWKRRLRDSPLVDGCSLADTHTLSSFSLFSPFLLFSFSPQVSNLSQQLAATRQSKETTELKLEESRSRSQQLQRQLDSLRTPRNAALEVTDEAKVSLPFSLSFSPNSPPPLIPVSGGRPFHRNRRLGAR